MMFPGILWFIGAGAPALLLVFLPPQERLICFTLAVLLETGHSLSPIVLAWSHREFRQRVIMRSRVKYVLLPGLMVCTAFAIGLVTQNGWTTYQLHVAHQLRILTDWTNPLPVLVWIYIIWNAYHFGMQNFGILALSWKGMPGGVRRVSVKLSCVVITAAGMLVLPMFLQSWTVGMICFGVFSFNHWIVEIGLCGRVSRHGWLFIAAVLSAGAIGFIWMIPTADAMMIQVIPVIICARMGLGFVHFLYDRWIWRMSDPLVRETIGKELFA